MNTSEIIGAAKGFVASVGTSNIIAVVGVVVAFLAVLENRRGHNIELRRAKGLEAGGGTEPSPGAPVSKTSAFRPRRYLAALLVLLFMNLGVTAFDSYLRRKHPPAVAATANVVQNKATYPTPGPVGPFVPCETRLKTALSQAQSLSFQAARLFNGVAQAEEKRAKLQRELRAVIDEGQKQNFVDHFFNACPQIVKQMNEVKGYEDMLEKRRVAGQENPLGNEGFARGENIRRNRLQAEELEVAKPFDDWMGKLSAIPDLNN